MFWHLIPSTSPDPIPPDSAFEPYRILEVELGQPFGPVQARDPRTDRDYTRAVILVRLHTEPIGMLTVDIPGPNLPAEQLAARIWAELATAINAHLRQDGLAPVATLSPTGLPAEQPKCEVARRILLQDAPLINVIIPTRDRPDFLREALRTLAQLDYPRYDITVVDSAPKTSATYDLITCEFPDVHYLREELPGSFRARNTALAHATGEIVAFTDDDVLVDRHWLANIFLAFRVHPDVTCVTGITMPAELESWSQLWFEQYGGFNKGFAQKRYSTATIAQHRAENPLFPYTAGKFGSGVNMAFKTAALRDMGGFDTVLSNGSTARGGGDIDAYYRIIMRGESLIYQPSALVYHFHRRDYASLYRQIFNYGVGLTAFLTKCVLTDPTRVLDLALRVPYGLYFALSPRSPKNRNKVSGFPGELTRRELRGMLEGPLAFVRGQWQLRDTAF